MVNPFHGVHPSELCPTHLRSAHFEIHKVVGSINAGTDLGELARYVDPERLHARHDELEDFAGYDSPLPSFEPPQTNHDVDEQFIRERLAKRCEACADRMLNTADAEQVIVEQ